MQYLTPGGKLPPYMAYPRFLLGMLLWGDVGTGKSFIAECIANALLDRGVPIRVNGQNVRKRMAAENMDAAR